MTYSVRENIRDLLYEYSEVFSKDEWDLGWTDVVTHTIDTGDTKPIRQQMRRYPPAHLVAIDKQINDMRKQGIIEPASSPWASNIVLAKKKDGTLRCCIDFRQVNDATKKDAYPLPRTDACLDAMSGCSYFSTFDLRSGYHQVKLQPEDSDKTAFITRRGMFKFKTMPFGLCNAGATFQRLMDLVLTGLNLEVCLVYLDDILVFSKTADEHLDRLIQVLKRLKEANLKLKPSKCKLMQREVAFLGHIVSGAGISTDPEKVRLIKQWPVPQDVRQLRGFLGLTGYYRRFVEDYALIATPLHNMTKKNCPFKWDAECHAAFEKLKHALSSPPILAMPDEVGTFTLDTDASESSIGAVLSQVQGGLERVIAYAGRKLSRNEQNYCVTRKELLAVVYFTKHFRQYLLGRKFVIRTDHAALSWLRKTPEPLGQNSRWLELLGEYEFDIRHRSGTKHGNADALSRHPCLNKPSCTACHLKDAECAPMRTGETPKIGGAANYTLSAQQTVSETTAGDDTEVKSVSKTADPAAVNHARSVEMENAVPSEQTPEIGGAANQGLPAHETAVRDTALGVTETSECVTNSGDRPSRLSWSDEEIAAAQRQDREIGFVMTLVENNQEKPPWKEVELQSSAVKSLWTEWERLEIRGGVLKRKWVSTDGLQRRWQIILPVKFRKEFIKLIHSGMSNGHLGRAKTEEQIKFRTYWPNWAFDVKMELKRCEPCAQYHRGKAPHQSYLNPIMAGEPFEVIAVDITGKHPKSNKGNEYIVTVIDMFSKWAEAYPVRNHTAPVVARVLMDNLCEIWDA